MLLGFTHPSDFGAGVDHPRHQVEVDVPVLASDALGHRDTFFFSLVRQHRPSDHIADRPDTRHVGTAVGINFDGTALVKLQTNRIAIQALGVRHTTDGDDQLINAERLRDALGVLVGNGDAFFKVLYFAYFDAQFNFEPLLGERLVSLFGNLLIHSTQESR